MTHPTQPQIGERKLLWPAYVHGDLALDLYGQHDGERYEVEAVSLAGQSIDISELFGARDLRSFAGACDAHLPGAEELRADRRDDVRALMVFA